MAAPALATTPPVARTAARSRTSPERMRRAMRELTIQTILFLLVTIFTTREYRDAFQTIGRDTAPAIVAAQRIKADLADMDSNAANELVGKPGENIDANNTFEARHIELGDALVTVSENSAFGETQRKPISALQTGVGTYMAEVQTARIFHERGDAAYLAAYRQATHLMHTTLLPAADTLTKNGHDKIEAEYAERKFLGMFGIGLLTTLGLVLLATLVRSQLFLTHLTHRTVNPGLFVATVLVCLFLPFELYLFSTATADLSRAKEQAFDSIYALTRTRAIAYDAKGDESRWLIDKALAPQYEQTFAAEMAAVAKLPPGQTYDAVAAACAQGDTVHLPDGFEGGLADELRNVTFPGERDSAITALKAFGAYAAVDVQLRALENQGNHNAAVNLCLGIDPGESNYQFAQFDQAITKTTDINQTEFDRSVTDGFHKLAFFEFIATAILTAAAGCALYGLNLRLREYA